MSKYQAQPQQKAKPAQSGAKLDESLLTSKKPSAQLDIDQRIATPGETVPIVFCKRTSGIGGTWVQPSLVKRGTRLFVPSYLYAVGQGEIVGTPATHRIFAGERNIAFVSGLSVTLSYDYATAAELSTAPNVCPIGGDTLFCGIDSFSYLSPLAKAQAGATFQEFYPATGYTGYSEITLGSGDTENTVYYFKDADAKVYRSDTGADVTSTWNTYFGITPGSEFALNAEYVGAQIKGRAVGTINDFIDAADPAFAKSVIADLADDAYLVYIAICDRVDTQADPGEPASTGTLFGVQNENLWSPYVDPGSVSTSNNSAYADITFLRLEGDISFRDTDEDGLSLLTKQVSVFFGQGVKVDLYSQGLSGGVYPTGASNQVVDLLMYLFTIYKRANGAAITAIASPIYVDNMADIAAFCNKYSLHYNGVLDASVNIIEFASAIAPFFLLSFLSIGGQYRLEPVLPINGSDEIDVSALTPAATFTEDQILPGSFSKAYKAAAERKPIIAVMLWRESNPSKIGIQRTMQVSFSTTSLDAPVEQFDMTDFCCNANHAAIYGKYQIARRHYSTHTITFDTALITTGLKPTDVIKIDRDRITSTGDNRSEIEWYQITSIKYSTSGVSTIEAEHFPVNGSNISLISSSILSGSFRVL